MNGFSLEDFNSNEIEILFNTSKNDSKIFDRIIRGNTLNLGIVNLTNENIDIALNVLNIDFNNLNCVIIRIRREIFCDRNMTYPIDWNLIYQIKEF